VEPVQRVPLLEQQVLPRELVLLHHQPDGL